MTWVTIDDQFPNHPKFLRDPIHGGLCQLIHLRAICYANQYLTDGYLPPSVMSALLTGLEHVGIHNGHQGYDMDEIDWPALMVRAKLWEKCREGGWKIHDYLVYQNSKDIVLQRRENTRERVRKHRSNATVTALQDPLQASCNAVSNAAPHPHPHPHPTPIHDERETNEKNTPPPPSRWEVGNGFDQFWQAYPEKKSKGQAEKTWIKLHPTVELLQQILAGVERAKQSPEWLKDGGEYIPNPSTWLNAKGWLDEPRAPVARQPTTAFQKVMAKIEQGRAALPVPRRLT